MRERKLYPIAMTVAECAENLHVTREVLYRACRRTGTSDLPARRSSLFAHGRCAALDSADVETGRYVPMDHGALNSQRSV